MQGYLEATHVGQFNFTALLECIYGLDQAAITLYFAITLGEEAIKERDFGKVVGSVTSAFATIAMLQ